MQSYFLLLLCFSDINECKTGRNTCANDTVCFNLEGGYDCRCPHGHNCTGDCIHDNKVKHSGQIWVLDADRCSVCSCQVRSGWVRWLLGHHNFYMLTWGPEQEHMHLSGQLKLNRAKVAKKCVSLQPPQNLDFILITLSCCKDWHNTASFTSLLLI